MVTPGARPHSSLRFAPSFVSQTALKPPHFRDLNSELRVLNSELAPQAHKRRVIIVFGATDDDIAFSIEKHLFYKWNAQVAQ